MLLEKKCLLEQIQKQEMRIFFIAEHEPIVSKLGGQIREELGKRLEIIDESEYRFCWIVDFPMYERVDNGKIEFCHNPFSMPQGGMEALETKEPLDILAYQYDTSRKWYRSSFWSC